MLQLESVIKSMIDTTKDELNLFLNQVIYKKFKKNDLLSKPNIYPNEIFFISKGLVRVTILDKGGIEQTIHFALENHFISDYSSFIQKKPSIYSLQALEETEVYVLPRSLIEWGYKNMSEGQKLGRLIAEFYFMYQDDRISNMYSRTPKERYDNITTVFPNIHNRVSQHMIASYLGITPIHLSRLKNPKI